MDMQYDNQNEKRRPMGCRGYVHVVEAGDTLYKISKKYDVKLFDIMRLNPYVNVYNLQIGDEICIPTAPPRPEKTYVVNAGDSIADVTRAFGLSFDVLAKYNPILLEAELPEGVILKVPLAMPRNDGSGSVMRERENMQMQDIEDMDDHLQMDDMSYEER